MSNSNRPNELVGIARDAASVAGNASDHQTANRLTLEVAGYMHDHKGGQVQKDLTKILTSAGLNPAEIEKVERMGLPTMQLTHAGDGSVKPKLTAQTTDSPNNDPRRRAEMAAQAGAPGSGLAEQQQTPRSLNDLVHEVHNVEDRYHMTDVASPQTQKDLGQALKDVQDFVKNNPDQADTLISKLQSQDLIGQLSIAAIEQTPAGQSERSLTRNDVTQLFDANDPLGKAFQDHLNTAFSVKPGGKNFGTGYADAVRQPNGSEYWGYSSSSGDTPVLTKYHRDELMQRFDHGPAYHGEG